MPAVPPPSKPRWGSTAPTVELRCCKDRVGRHNRDSADTADPLWELPSFSEAAIAAGQAMKMPAVPPPSQPRRGSTAPTVELRCCTDYVRRHNRDSADTADPLWELPSFSEAAIAVGQAMKMPAVPPPSQPRRGSIHTFNASQVNWLIYRHRGQARSRRFQLGPYPPAWPRTPLSRRAATAHRHLRPLAGWPRQSWR